MTGIIFDFNGTMVFDSHLHEQAWVHMIQKHKPELSEEEIIDYIHGRTNDVILNHFIGNLSDDEIQMLAAEKEQVYQDEVRKERLQLIDGVEDLLDTLVEKDVAFTIATASPKMNVDFYFDYFELGKWFDPSRVIYDDGSFPGKPEPDIYKKAAATLGFKPEDCIVFEDAVTGIQSANAAGIGQIIAMVSSDDMRAEYESSSLKYTHIVEDFHEVFTILKDDKII